MTNGGYRYAISRRRRLIDLGPTIRGELPLVWIPDQDKWIDLELTFGEHVDSVPVTDQEAERFMKTGEISSMHTSRQGEMPEDSSEE